MFCLFIAKNMLIKKVIKNKILGKFISKKKKFTLRITKTK